MALRFLLGVAFFLASCALPQQFPRFAALEAVPTDLDHYLTNSGWRGDYRVSPDGERLLWIEQAPDGELVIAAQRVSGGDIARFPAGRLASMGTVFTQVAWLGDSRHIAWARDEKGDENTQLWVVNTDNPDAAPRNLTPWAGAKTAIHATGGPKGTQMLIVSNRRDARVFDLLRMDYATGEATEIARNPGDVENWISDAGSGMLAGRIRGEGRMRILEIMDQAGAPWRELRRWPATGSYVRALNRSRSTLILATNQGHNTLALVRVDLKTGAETVVFKDPKLDVVRSYYTSAPERVYAVQTEPGYPRTRILLPDVEEPLAKLLGEAAGGELLGFEIQSTDRPVNRMIFRTHTRAGTQEVLFERRSAKLTVLRDSRKHPLAGKLAISEPVVITARGYAVLRVNYRGSDGYGEEHLLAGAGSLGDRTQDDIEDAVRWAIREGIADPARIAASGGSFGGYSVLKQLVRGSGLYRCGIDVDGVADWRRMIERHPPYWWGSTELYHLNYADPRTPQGIAELKRISPLHEVEKIKVPLLLMHGRTDIRVPVEDSEDVHAGLQKLGRESHLIVFEDEGHSIRSLKNRLAAWRATDAFLKRCLNQG